MGRSDQVQEAKDGRIDKVTEFRCHLGNFGCLSFKLLRGLSTTSVHFDLPHRTEYMNVQYRTNRKGNPVPLVVARSSSRAKS